MVRIDFDFNLHWSFLMRVFALATFCAIAGTAGADSCDAYRQQILTSSELASRSLEVANQLLLATVTEGLTKSQKEVISDARDHIMDGISTFNDEAKIIREREGKGCLN